MSYCRWSAWSDVYVIGSADERYECCGCKLDPKPGWNYDLYTTALEIIAHLEDHVARGHKVVHWAFERLRIDARREALKAAGYVPQQSRWTLPRQLGLALTAPTRTRYVGRYLDDAYSTDYHCRGGAEPWALAWAERVAKLPIPITERRRVLLRVAIDARRRDALAVALIANPELPNRVFLDISEAELGEITAD